MAPIEGSPSDGHRLSSFTITDGCTLLHGLVKRYQAEVSHLLVHAALVPRCLKARIPLMLESEGPFELPTTLLPRTALK